MAHVTMAKSKSSNQATLVDIVAYAEQEIEYKSAPDRKSNFQQTIRHYYKLSYVRTSVATITFVYFCIAIIKSQMELELVDNPNILFNLVEYIFTAIFTFDFVVNVLTCPFMEFIQSFWNLFDSMVIPACIGIVITGSEGWDFLLASRSAKIFQNFADTVEVESLYISMVHSLGASFTIVGLLLLIMTVYAIGGVESFRDIEKDDFGDEFFGTYSRAMITLLQCLLCESWSSGVGRPVMDVYPVKGAFFFVTYVIFVSIIVMNFVAAIFLDAFLVGKEESTDDYKRRKFQILFDHLDADGGGTLDEEELNDLADDLERAGMSFDVDELFRQADAIETKEINFESFFDAYGDIIDPSLSKHKGRYQDMNEKLNSLSFLAKDIYGIFLSNHAIAKALTESIDEINAKLKYTIHVK